jgi:hypothetical protein
MAPIDSYKVDPPLSDFTDEYKLLKDYHDPCGMVLKGVSKTEHQWMARFALLNPGDCKKKTDWFKRVN